MQMILRSLVLAIAPVAAFAQAPTRLPPQQVMPSAQDAQWKPADADAERLVKQTYAYLAAKDQKRFADAYAAFAPSQKQTVPFDGWRKQLETFYGEAGALQGRKVQKITWYRDPPNTPPGVYAAVDVTSRFANLSLHCGYVAWRQQADGSFEVVREQANSLQKADAARMTPEMMQQAKAQFGCR